MPLTLTPSQAILHFPGSELPNYRSMLINAHGVYALFSPITGNYYIGSSVNLFLRLSDYSQSWWLISYSYLPLGKAIAKYGFEHMIIAVLEFTDEDKTVATEQLYLDTYAPAYNVLKVAGSTLGHKHTDESKAKMSKAKLGKPVSPEALENMRRAWVGRGKDVPKSDQHKAKISDAMKGKTSPKAKLIKVLDYKTGDTIIYNGYVKTAAALGIGVGAVRYNLGRDYLHYHISEVKR